jgi:hypothetical protein
MALGEAWGPMLDHALFFSFTQPRSIDVGMHCALCAYILCRHRYMSCQRPAYASWHLASASSAIVAFNAHCSLRTHEGEVLQCHDLVSTGVLMLLAW